MTLIERVARAIEVQRSRHPIDGDAQSSINLARAAIEAMREPTDAMVRTGDVGDQFNDGAALIWQLMIDAALGEEP